MRRIAMLSLRTEGSALVEFAIVLPLLVVFLVGIYDFSGAFNQKQKIEHAAQEGASIAATQPLIDLDPATANPVSLQPVAAVIANSLTAGNVLPQGGCAAPAGAYVSGLMWQYTISCGPDTLTIKIDRGVVGSGSPGLPVSLGTSVEVIYPYHWRFNSAIQLLFPGASYTPAVLRETATVHNQL